MRFRRFRPGLVAAALLMLGACASVEREEPESPAAVVIGPVLSGLKARLSGRPAAGATPALQLTRARLAGITTRLWLVQLEKTGAVAGVTKAAENRGFTTYLSPDSRAVILKRGLLAGTRGLAGDLMEADLAPLEAALRGRGPRDYSRSVAWLNGEDRLQRVTLTCRLTKQGRETIEIVERRYATIRYRETCRSDAGPVVSDFWLAAGGGEIWQSRQWAGGVLGHLGLQLLVP